jgi:formyltetrahydrofolate deformylase
MNPRNTATLLISSPDQKGLVAAISAFLLKNDANILHADQHLDSETSLFLMRVEWDLKGFRLTQESFPEAFAPIVVKFSLQWKLSYSKIMPRMAIFVSKVDHCLVDLLYRQRSGEIRCEIPLIVSNHPDTGSVAEFYKIPFHFIPTSPSSGDQTKGETQSKTKIEDQQIALLQNHKIDLIVLARYMQILSPRFVKEFKSQIINIHHSFLPAFLGARPYHRAFERGVKLIGATSHYVTDALDDGPIIEQDVIRISHRDVVEDLIQKGRDLEKWVLSRAVRWHLENRILIYGNKTVVFD